MLFFFFYLVLEHHCSCVTGSFAASICAKDWVMVESLSIWAHFCQSWFWTQSRPLELTPPSTRSGHTGNGKDPAKLHLDVEPVLPLHQCARACAAHRLHVVWGPYTVYWPTWGIETGPGQIDVCGSQSLIGWNFVLITTTLVFFDQKSQTDSVEPKVTVPRLASLPHTIPTIWTCILWLQATGDRLRYRRPGLYQPKNFRCQKPSWPL